mgnify:CR=1 FL=1
MGVWLNRFGNKCAKTQGLRGLGRALGRQGNRRVGRRRAGDSHLPRRGRDRRGGQYPREPGQRTSRRDRQRRGHRGYRVHVAEREGDVWLRNVQPFGLDDVTQALAARGEVHVPESNRVEVLRR